MKDDTLLYAGPCKIDCPRKCDVPAGVVMIPVPHSKAWSDADGKLCALCNQAFLAFAGASSGQNTGTGDQP